MNKLEWKVVSGSGTEGELGEEERLIWSGWVGSCLALGLHSMSKPISLADRFHAKLCCQQEREASICIQLPVHYPKQDHDCGADTHLPRCQGPIFGRDSLLLECRSPFVASILPSSEIYIILDLPVSSVLQCTIMHPVMIWQRSAVVNFAFR